MVKVKRLYENDIGRLIELSLAVDPFDQRKTGCSYWSFGFEQGMKVWGILSDDKLVASAGLTYYDLPGEAMGIKDYRLMVLDNGQVHPDYRGRGYQRLLIFLRTACALWEGNYLIESYVEIDNVVCIKNLERRHYQNMGEVETEGVKIYSFQYNNSWVIKLFKIFNKIFKKTKQEKTET